MTLKTVNLTTRPSRGQSYEEWLKTWDDVLAAGHQFNAGVTRGRGVDGHIGMGELTTQHPEYAKLIKANLDDITYVIYAWETPMAVWVERGEGFWLFPDVRYVSPETGKNSTKTTRIQNHLRYMVGRQGEKIVEGLNL